MSTRHFTELQKVFTLIYTVMGPVIKRHRYQSLDQRQLIRADDKRVKTHGEYPREE